MSAKKKSARKNAGGKKKATPSLQLVLKELNRINRRLDRLDSVDQKVDAVDQKVDAHRQETAKEFEIVRKEMSQIYFKLDNKIETKSEEYRKMMSHLLTGMDQRAGEYQKFDDESAVIFAKQDDMGRDIEKLKEKDAELEKRIADLEAAHEPT